jgi:hypothetical protein
MAFPPFHSPSPCRRWPRHTLPSWCPPRPRNSTPAAPLPIAGSLGQTSAAVTLPTMPGELPLPFIPFSLFASRETSYPRPLFPCSMWDKPKQLTSYHSAGFEILTQGYGSLDENTVAQEAVRSWSRSAPHNSVMLNQGKWSGEQNAFRAIGCAFGARFTLGAGKGMWVAVCWFGVPQDPNVLPTL